MRLRSFFELGKLKIVELWLGFFVGVSLIGRPALEDGRTIAILAAILITGIAVIAATCSLDDITGVRDGVDQANHLEGARWGVAKPILTGALAERHAFRFVHVLGAIGVLSYGVALALAWPLPAWLVITMTAMMLLALNYSYGLKLSYHGLGELVIFVGGAGTVLVPYALATGSIRASVIVSAILVGAWHAQVVVFSNTKDRAGDRATHRMTIAARTSPRGNKIYIASLFAIVWAVTAVALAEHLLTPWSIAALAPVWGLQLYQLWSGLAEEQWLRARLAGFRVLRLGIVAMTVVNLCAPR
jgi:1,4-dihydroxy-2-naphthoate octaprenyltransferase